MYESHRICLSACVSTPDFLVLTKYTAGSHLPVWPKPGNEPLVVVDRAILVTVHHQATVLVRTAIRSLLQGHVLFVFTCNAHPGRIAFAYYIQFFPKAQTLVFKHLHKAVESLIIIYHVVADTLLIPLLTCLVLFLGNDHLLVESSTLVLHEFERGSILTADFDLDLFTQ
jgi:hypothetical protein